MFVEPEGGHRGILDCRVDSEPLAILTLHRGSQLVASNQLHSAPAQPYIQVTAPPNALRVDIEELGPSNQGEYVCTASNTLGSASASAYFGTRGEGTIALPSGPSLQEDSHVLKLPSQIPPATRQLV